MLERRSTALRHARAALCIPRPVSLEREEQHDGARVEASLRRCGACRGCSPRSQAETHFVNGMPDDVVGHDDELAVISSAIASCANDGSRFLLVTTSQRAEKTAVFRAAKRLARAHGVRAHWIRASRLQGAGGFHPWERVLRSILNGSGHTGPELDRESLRGTLRDLARAIRDPGGTSAFAGGERFRLMDRIVQALLSASRRAPRLIVVDDLQLLNATSVEILQMLVGVPRTEALVILGIVDASLRGASACSRRKLADLVARAEIIRLSPTLDELRPSEPGRIAPGELAAGDREGARPHLLMLSTPESEHVFPNARGGSDMGRHGHGSVVSDVLRSASRLSETSRRFLAAAAIVGREFDGSTVRRVTESSGEDLFHAIDECRDAGLIELAEAPGTFRFTRALLVDALREQLSPAFRAELHRRIAEALEREGRDDDETLGHLVDHHARSRAPDSSRKAAEYALQIGARRLSEHSHAEAIRHLEAGLRVAPPRPSAGDCVHGEILLALAQAQRRSGDIEPARRTFLRAMDFARDVHDGELLARAALGATGLWTKTVMPREENLRALDEALSVVDEHHGPLRAWLLARLASELAFCANDGADRRIPLLTEAIEIARASKDDAALTYSMNTLHLVGQAPGSRDPRYGSLAALAWRSEAPDDDLPTMDGVGWAISGLLERGELSMLDAAVSEYDRHAAQSGDLELLRNVRNWQAMRSAMKGDFAAAESFASQSRALGERLQFPDAGLYRTVILAPVRAVQGRIHEIENELRVLASDYAGFPIVRYWLLWLDVVAGRLEDARRRFDRLAADRFEDLPRDYTWRLAASICADASVILRDRMSAMILYGMLSPHAGRMVVAGNALALHDVVHRVVGSLAHLLGRFDVARTHYRAAIAQLEAASAWPLLARTCCEIAEVRMHDEGCLDREARRLVERARDLADRMELPMLSERISALSAVSGGEVPAEEESPTSERRGVMQSEGDYWRLELDGVDVRVRSMRGLQYIEALLRQPGQDIHVMDLISESARPCDQPDVGRDHEAAERLNRGLGHAGAALDADARRAYRRRVEEIREALTSPRLNGPDEHRERLAEEQRFIERELAAAFGLRGRSRQSVSIPERARISVRHAIARAIARLELLDPSLAAHLRLAIATGTFCVYRGDVRRPVVWSFGECQGP